MQLSADSSLCYFDTDTDTDVGCLSDGEVSVGLPYTKDSCYVCEAPTGTSAYTLSQTRLLCDACHDAWFMFSTIMWGQHGFFPLRDNEYIQRQFCLWLDTRRAAQHTPAPRPTVNACMFCRSIISASNDPDRLWRGCTACDLRRRTRGRKRNTDQGGVGAHRRSLALRNSMLYGWHIPRDQNVWVRCLGSKSAVIRFEYPGWRLWINGSRRGFFNTAHNARMSANAIMQNLWRIESQ